AASLHEVWRPGDVRQSDRRHLKIPVGLDSESGHRFHVVVWAWIEREGSPSGRKHGVGLPAVERRWANDNGDRNDNRLERAEISGHGRLGHWPAADLGCDGDAVGVARTDVLDGDVDSGARPAPYWATWDLNILDDQIGLRDL